MERRFLIVKTEQLNPPATHHGQFLETVRENLTAFSDVERRIARAILNDPAGVINQSIGEFAAVAGVSAASAVRFCQALSLSSFQELKLVLTRSSPERSVIATDVDGEDSAETVSRKVILNSALSSATPVPPLKLSPRRGRLRRPGPRSWRSRASPVRPH